MVIIFDLVHSVYIFRLIKCSCACATVGHVLHELPDGNTVVGVTSLDNRLYVLRASSQRQIEVYDKDSYRLEACITVPGLHCAGNDIVACAHNYCIYACNINNDRVHRVKLQLRYGSDITNWPVHDVPRCLSVAETHSVLVTCHKIRKIKEFTTDGKLLRQFQLPRDVLAPRHTIQLSSGEFVMCHGRFHDPVHRVCLIDSYGQVLSSYGRPAGCGRQQTGVLSHLAVDRNGSVFVADMTNKRVLLLSPELTFVREVLLQGQLEWTPRRLWLDSDRRRLYVAVSKWEGAYYTTGRVVVVSVD